MFSVYSSRRGPVPMLTKVSHMARLPVKSEMRPPNSADCLTTKPLTIWPSFASVSIAGGRSVVLRAPSTAMLGETGLTGVSFLSLLSVADCENAAIEQNRIAAIRAGAHVLTLLDSIYLMIVYPLPSRLEEEMVSIRPVNGYVTHGAGLILLRLIVERRNCRSARINGEGVALKTEQVDVAATQQPRIGRSVRHVAGEAELVLGRRGAELVR